jgi:UDP-N-acetylmuramyl tripeptide synthase
MWHLFVITLTKTLIAIGRGFGFGGTALPGLVAEKLSPKLLARLTATLPHGVVIVTGTNGKTTTTKITRQVLEARGLKVLANRSGSNFSRGVLASVIEHATLGGTLPYDIAILEVDEAYTRIVARQIEPRAICVLNIMRDQLDRYGEIDTTARLIGAAIKYSRGVILNAQDPPVAQLHEYLVDEDNVDTKTTYFGVDNKLRAHFPSDDELLDTATKKSAQLAANPTVVELVKYDEHLHAPNQASYRVGKDTYSAELQLDGIHNALNMAAALTIVQHLFNDVDATTVATLNTIKPAFGRGEKLEIDGVQIHLGLVKNPGGFNQNLRAYVTDQTAAVLIMINDQYADGRDVSWLWDVDIAPLKETPAEIYVSGLRGYDMALRLEQDGRPVDWVETDIKQALKTAIHLTPKGGELLILPTYTAMLRVRKLVARKVETEEIWH